MERLIDRDRLASRLRALLQAQRPDAGAEVPGVETRLAEVKRRIERAVQMVLAGTEDVPSLRAVLVGLERERLRLESQLAAAQAPQGDSGGLDSIVGAILAELEDIRSVLLHGEPEQRRELVRRSWRESGSKNRRGRPSSAGTTYRVRLSTPSEWWS